MASGARAALIPAGAEGKRCVEGDGRKVSVWLGEITGGVPIHRPDVSPAEKSPNREFHPC